MLSKTISIALVSGKGGVGKTTLASNLGWMFSQIGKTVLIDLDFQNQGCSGLLSSYVQDDDTNAIDAIQKSSPSNLSKLKPNLIAPNLFFIPAISWKQRPLQDTITKYVNEPEFSVKLENFISGLRSQHEFEVIIFDCHGGVDPVSSSAFQSCDFVLMVTEADRVSFNGTLELLDYYQSHLKSRANKNKNFMDQPAKLSFIVNRLPSKYRWKDLREIFQRSLADKLDGLSAGEPNLYFIPHEELLADSFGEYPFQVELAPFSIFSKKIKLMVYQMLKISGELKNISNLKIVDFDKLKKEKYRRKIEKLVISNENQNKKNVMAFFAFSTFSWLALLLLCTFEIIKDLDNSNSDIFNVCRIVIKKFESVWTFLISLILFFDFLLFFWAQMGLMFYHIHQHKFAKSLYKALSKKTGQPINLWQQVSLTNLLILRLATSTFPVLFGFSIVLIIFSFLSDMFFHFFSF